MCVCNFHMVFGEQIAIFTKFLSRGAVKKNKMNKCPQFARPGWHSCKIALKTAKLRS